MTRRKRGAGWGTAGGRWRKTNGESTGGRRGGGVLAAKRRLLSVRRRSRRGGASVVGADRRVILDAASERPDAATSQKVLSETIYPVVGKGAAGNIGRRRFLEDDKAEA
ncbi:hypothetical protein GWI33_009955 [Rhynchophorus ferrugineus]|uniref:Uncharacterized protein n=1 Tax=Rhynchophorus ferrugineus TaxID=354439 RepID=A0A834ISY1_RHYFE|nr:hypothetical protein GWI33_009955 [Rhynchophorus ferrugineus]